MLTCDSKNLINQCMNFKRMLKQYIEQVFDEANLSFKPERY